MTFVFLFFFVARFYIQASKSREKNRWDQEEEQEDHHYGYSQPGPERAWYVSSLISCWLRNHLMYQWQQLVDVSDPSFFIFFTALQRSSTFQPLVSQLPDHNKHDGQSGVVIIPTVDGGTPITNKEGARVHLSELEVNDSPQTISFEPDHRFYSLLPLINCLLTHAGVQRWRAGEEASPGSVQRWAQPPGL